MSELNYYQVLGIKGTAGLAAVEDAYDSKLKALLDGLYSVADVSKRTAELECVRKAFLVLSNEATRAIYDRLGHTEYERVAAGSEMGQIINKEVLHSAFRVVCQRFGVPYPLDESVLPSVSKERPSHPTNDCDETASPCQKPRGLDI